MTFRFHAPVELLLPKEVTFTSVTAYLLVKRLKLMCREFHLGLLSVLICIHRAIVDHGNTNFIICLRFCWLNTWK